MTSRRDAKTRIWLLDTPELNVVIFAFLLNLAWEFWQVPLFREMVNEAHWDGVKTCTRATAADAGIALVSFWSAALVARSRYWITAPRKSTVAVFIGAGLAITIVAEWFATEVLHRWSYGEHMPLLPVLGTGLAPVLQWVLIPPLVVWFVRRQLT